MWSVPLTACLFKLSIPHPSSAPRFTPPSPSALHAHSGREVAEVDLVHGSRGMAAAVAARVADVSSDDEAGLLLDLGDDGGSSEEEEEQQAGGEAEVGRGGGSSGPKKGRASVGGKLPQRQQGGASRGGGTGVAAPGEEVSWGRKALGRSAPWWHRQQGAEAAAGRGGAGGFGSACEGADMMTHLSTLASMQLLSKVRHA